jgi:hypothetical protein
MDDNMYAHLPNFTMEKNIVEENGINPETEDIPEVVEESLSYFFPDDFPFTQEEYFYTIECPKN